MNQLKLISATFLLLSLSFFVFETFHGQDEFFQAEFGHRLFFDKHLSHNHTKSCASCHDPLIAFSDGYRTSVSPSGENLKHNAPSILNASALHVYDWANSKATTLAKQISRPLFGKHPVELGLDTHWQEFVDYVMKDKLYQRLYHEAFPESQQLTQEQLITSLVAYEKKLIAMNSSYDGFKALRHNLLPSQIRGKELFFSDQLKCASCHGGPMLTNASLTQNPDSVYFNIGLYNVDGQNRYPTADRGLFDLTLNPKDDGKFKVPSLRNVALTAPYMHDGSVATLNEVINLYARGGRNTTAAVNHGDGRLNANKHPFISGFSISDAEKQYVIEFLETLTDTSYLQNPFYLNPRNYSEDAY